ncbi:MAG: PadR family transcriptional regulator [Candidatus Hydrogenedentota bacterium]|nr:MAG: PadR family transcriptional regulator [Candidatus Hydrogenedentota bacterium]
MDPKLLTGTVEMLILQIVLKEPTYGYSITQEVLERSKGYFQLKEGSLYPALHRLERERLLESYWERAESGRRRKYYRITPAGKKSLEVKRGDWQEFTVGVNGVLGASANVVA